MKRVRLSESDRVLLQQRHKSASSHRERMRAHAILLSNKGYALEILSEIFECDRDTVSRWLDDWQEHGVAGLSDAPKSGRPRKLDDNARAFIAQSLHSPTPQFKPLLQEQLKKGVMP